VRRETSQDFRKSILILITSNSIIFNKYIMRIFNRKKKVNLDQEELRSGEERSDNSPPSDCVQINPILLLREEKDF